MTPPTTRQKQFLRALGHKEFGKLSKESASSLIDKLLQEERASGKTFPCPYCKARFGPRPRRTKKCPKCKNTIVHLSGHFYTQEKADEIFEKNWRKQAAQQNREEVRESWRFEKANRRELGEPSSVGYLIEVGQHCAAAAKRDRSFVSFEDAIADITLLPPFETCCHDTCECDYHEVLAEEVGRKQRKKSTRRAKTTIAESVARKAKAAFKIGCLIVILFFAAIAAGIIFS